MYIVYVRLEIWTYARIVFDYHFENNSPICFENRALIEFSELYLTLEIS